MAAALTFVGLRGPVATTGRAQPAAAEEPRLEVRWELIDDVFDASHPDGVSRAVLTITNRGDAPLPAGWSLYCSALEPAAPETVLSGNGTFTHMGGDLHRFVATANAPSALAPTASLRVEYLTRMLMTNIGEAPRGAYVVVPGDPPRVGAVALEVVPFARPPQRGREARLLTPAEQYRRNTETRERATDELPPVLPTPEIVERRPGAVTLVQPPRVNASAALAGEASLLLGYIAAKLSAVSTSPAAPHGPEIRLAIGRVPGFDSPESYELVVDRASGIRVTGASAAGVFYGVQTLRALLPRTAAREVSLPGLRIVDAPRFPYRGLMLDVARNFQAKDRVFRVLDLMARYKLNTLHFHLTDDEGWRLEIPELPELTAVGARRGYVTDGSALPPAFGSGPSVDPGYGSGFYSTADYLDILRYAAARHIDVVPEIEMPGHARAAILSMEMRYRDLLRAGDVAGAERYRLVEPDDRSVYRSAQRYDDNVLNPALESTYAFVETVIGRVARLHRDAGVPLRYVHVGGDEVPTGAWERSPAAEAARTRVGAAHVRELWFPFYARVEQILARHGAGVAGWEEIGLRLRTVDGRPRYEPNPDFAHREWRTYVWNNIGAGAEDLAYRLANRGYKVVLTPVTHLYFDLAYNQNPEERGLKWGGYVDVDKPFQFIPLDYLRNLTRDRAERPIDRATFAGAERLTPDGARNVIGVQGSLWSETLYADGRLDEMLVPKLFGLAERAWAPEPDWSREREAARAAELYRAAWSSFATAVGKRELPRLVEDIPGLAYHIPTPGLAIGADGAVVANLQLPGFVLRYTTDGSEPAATSPELRGPIRAAGTVTVAAFDATGRRGHSARLAVPARQ